MKYTALALMLIAVFAAAGQPDAEGCKDSKILPRFRNSVISECSQPEGPVRTARQACGQGAGAGPTASDRHSSGSRGSETAAHAHRPCVLPLRGARLYCVQT